jgi:hypothetical protein
VATVEQEIFDGMMRQLEGGLAGLGLATTDLARPNVAFTEPVATPTAKWLRPTLLSAETSEMGVAFASKNTHMGLFQVSVFYGKGGGETAPRTIAAGIVGLFERGTVITEGSTKIRVLRPPFLLPVQSEEKWIHVPVRVPYECYASNPA